VINIYPELNMSLGAVNITPVAENSDFVALRTACFLDFHRPMSFISGHDFSEVFCPAQCPIFGQIQKQRNTVAQPCHKSGFFQQPSLSGNVLWTKWHRVDFCPCALAFFCLYSYNSASTPFQSSSIRE